MRAIVQRVRQAEVEVDGRVTGRMERGLLVYVGVAPSDAQGDVDWLAGKVACLRIFQDDKGKMNLSVQDVGGGVLVVPNFTLLADAAKGRRPAFVGAAPPDLARGLYDALVSALAKVGCQVACGVFGAHMTIRSAADGPVNIILDTLDAGAPPQQILDTVDAGAPPEQETQTPE